MNTTAPWAFAQESPVSIPSTIDVHPIPVMDWSFLLLAAAFTAALIYAFILFLDNGIEKKRTAETAREWSKLNRAIRNGRRDFGGAL